MAFNPYNQKSSGTRHIDDVSPIEIYKMEVIPDASDIQDYDMDDDGDIDKFINDCEKICRASFEYQVMIQYIRNYMNMNHCTFWTGVSNIDTTAIKIHLHHSPITLYEIVSIVLEKRKFYNECLWIEQVAKEAVYVHYCCLIGLIPVCETVHTLIHNEYIFVPNDLVYGNYKEFLELYKPWIPTQIQDKMDRIEEFSKVCNMAENLSILQPHYIHLDYAGSFQFPKMEDVLNIVEKRMKDLQANCYSMEQVPLFTFIPQQELENTIQQQVNEEYERVKKENPIPLIDFMD